jgi:acyl-CoA thioesterase I
MCLRMPLLYQFLALAIATIACNGDPGSPTAPGQPVPVIVAFGDSLTSGPGLRPDQTYPALLQQRISSEGYHYRVVNAGVTGDTTSEALPRFEQALVPDTRIVIIALGINDGLRGVPVATVERNITTMIERAQARNIKVLLCGMEAPPLGGFSYSIEFHRAFTRMADRFQLPLVPFFLLRVAGDPDLNLEDRFHPNAAGHRVIADTIWPYLRPMLLSPATGGVI